MKTENENEKKFLDEELAKLLEKTLNLENDLFFALKKY